MQRALQELGALTGIASAPLSLCLLVRGLVMNLVLSSADGSLCTRWRGPWRLLFVMIRVCICVHVCAHTHARVLVEVREQF